MKEYTGHIDYNKQTHSGKVWKYGIMVEEFTLTRDSFIELHEIQTRYGIDEIRTFELT